MNRGNDEADLLLHLAMQDWAILQRIKDAPEVELAGICFHAQQCVEKCLKAILALQGLSYERTHNLVRLAKTYQDGGGVLPVSLTDLSLLNPCAVTYRYGDIELPHMGRKAALDIAEGVLSWARSEIDTTAM